MRPIDIFHIGPQKSATTWIYQCLFEHPDVAVPTVDSIHYFDMFYVRGREWYMNFFTNAKIGQKLFDPTPSYIRSTLAPSRIFEENPKAKIILCLRHPIERAFSHYWHEKKRRRFNFTFSEFQRNYDLFNSWIEPGFYARHIERYLEFFPREQMLWQLFDELEENPRNFLKQLLDFIEVDSGFSPSVIDKRINTAAEIETRVKVTTKKNLEKLGLLELAISVKVALRRLGLAKERGQEGPKKDMERLTDIAEDVIRLLNDICMPEIERLERLTEIDLHRWRRYG